MLNTSTLNSAPLNGFLLTTVPIADDFDDLEFEGVSLQDGSSVISQQILVDSTPSRELTRYLIPRNHGGIFTGDYFRERRVRVQGILQEATSAALETAIDTFKRVMTTPEGNLDLKKNGEIRRIKASLANPEQMFSRREAYHITYCPFDLEFLSLEPFWHDIDYTGTTYESITNLAYSQSIENLGTFKANPVLIVLFEVATSVTDFEFENTTNGQVISVTRSFAAGDILIIDCEEKSVTVNSVEVDYNGIFPDLEYGSNTFDLTTTGAAVQYTATLKFRKTYL